jgi:hypothetical protein
MEMNMLGLFDTWLGFLGVVAGLVLAAVYGWRPLRSAVVGFAAGLVLVTLVNGLSGEPPPCLQQAKGRDILRAYSTICEKEPQGFLELLGTSSKK